MECTNKINMPSKTPAFKESTFNHKLELCLLDTQATSI